MQERLDTGGAEIEECTPQVRWAPRSMMQAHDLKLQQAWRVSVIERGGRMMGSRIEWRDVPTVLD